MSAYPHGKKRVLCMCGCKFVTRSRRNSRIDCDKIENSDRLFTSRSEIQHFIPILLSYRTIFVYLAGEAASKMQTNSDSHDSLDLMAK